MTLGANTLTVSAATGTFSGTLGAAGDTGGFGVSGGTQTLNAVTTGYTGATLIASGAGLTLTGASNLTTSSGVVDNGAFNISGNGATTITSLSGSGAVALGANTLTLSSASGTFSGGIGGAGGLTLTAGIETLSGTNAYTGATSIGGGAALVISGAGSLGSGSYAGPITDNGTFVYSSSATQTLSGVISGVGALAQNGTGALTLTGANTYSGTTSIGTGSSLTIGGAGSLGAGTYAGAITDNGSFVHSSTTAQTLSGAISGAGSLTQNGTGALTLTGLNSYAGLTTIASGTLALTGTGSIAFSSGVVDDGTFDISASSAPGASIATLSGSGAVALGGNTLTLTNASGTFGGAIGGTGGLNLALGTETLAGANTYTGTTTLAAATTLNVNGSLGSAGTPTGAINVGAGANLNVGGAGSIFSGLLTNGGDLTVAFGGLLKATELNNLSNGKVFNFGTITDDLFNAGAVTNGGVYNANIALNTGAIVNQSGATWNGEVLSGANTSGAITNLGTWNGATSYNDGGTLINAGAWNGSLVANGGVLTNRPGATISGDVTMTGNQATVFALGRIGGSVTVNGPNGVFYVGDATSPTGNPNLGQTLTVAGNVTGTVTVPVNLTTGQSNVIKVGGSTAGGSVALTGNLTNAQNRLWADPLLTYSNASLPLTASSQLVLAGANSTGFYQYTPENNDSILQSLKAGVVSAPAAQVSTIITALTTSFFENAQAFLGAPTNPTPNLLYGGIWSRGGGAAITLELTATGGGSSYSTETKSINDIGGYQFGVDEGLYNINNSKMNVHFGLTAGEAFASSSDTFNTPGLLQAAGGVSTNANVPFYGVYAALTGNGLAATFQWRRNLFDLSLTDPSLGTQGPQKLNAQGNTESVDVGYQIPFGNGYSFTPSAAFFFSQTNVDSLGVGSSIFQFDALNSTLGRFGGRLATAYSLNENLFLVPYLTMNVWHEFQGTSTTNFLQAGSIATTVPAVVTSSVGTFGQVSLGFATQSPKSNITTYLQADLRVGSNIQGWGVIGGLRYSY